jgi:hypothetical protein
MDPGSATLSPNVNPARTSGQVGTGGTEHTQINAEGSKPLRNTIAGRLAVAGLRLC